MRSKIDEGADRRYRPSRVVFDANVLISAIFSAKKSPAGPTTATVNLALGGSVELYVCPRLLDEIEGVLSRPRAARLVDPREVPSLMGWILAGSSLVDDPAKVERVCRDPKDDYLVALAKQQRAALVTGDRDLLGGTLAAYTTTA